MHVARHVDLSSVDQRVFMRDVSFQAYEAMLAWRGERALPRMTYLEGELELMTPSIDHEGIKKTLARLIEAWAEEAGIELEGAGSWTVKSRATKRGAEADECYFVGAKTHPIAPDIAIEVVWTKGGIDKLDVWRKLGALEVWIWRDGALSFHVLSGERYHEKARSRLLPSLDPALLARCMSSRTQTGAVKELRAAMSSPAPRRRTRR
jgi:Uma2 family endonuclease